MPWKQTSALMGGKRSYGGALAAARAARAAAERAAGPPRAEPYGAAKRLFRAGCPGSEGIGVSLLGGCAPADVVRPAPNRGVALRSLGERLFGSRRRGREDRFHLGGSEGSTVDTD